MKLKVRTAPTAPVKAFLDEFSAASETQKIQLLKSFQWTYDKGDLRHWYPLLNYFDDFLSKLGTRKDIQLDCEGPVDEEPFPVDFVLGLLHTTTVILDNSHNKHLYASAEHIPFLLSSPKDAVVDSVLTFLATFAKKPSPNLRTGMGTREMMSRLLIMTDHWGGEQVGQSMVACCQQPCPEASKAVFENADSFEIVFHPFRQEGMHETHVKSPLEETVTVRNTVSQLKDDSSDASDYTLLRKAVQEHRITKPFRFQLLHKIRSSRHLHTPGGRLMLISRRLLAYIMYMQCGPTSSSVPFTSISEVEAFTNDLLLMVNPEANVPEPIKAIAIRALATQVQQRVRNLKIIPSVAAHSREMWGTIARKGVERLMAGETDEDLIALMDSILAFFVAIGLCAEGVHLLGEMRMLPAIMPLLKYENRDHLRLVSQACRAIDSYVEGVESGLAEFNEVEGLKILAERLMMEVTRVPDRLLSSDEHGECAQLPLADRNVIRFLLRAGTNREAQANGAARDDDEALKLILEALRLIILKSKKFGAHLYTACIMAVSEMMHNDPLEYPRLEKAGVPAAFCKSLQKDGVPLSPECICQVPQMVSAISLHSEGLKFMQSTSVLNCLHRIFTDSVYLRCLNGECIYNFGNSLDELIRHHPIYKEALAKIFVSAVSQNLYVWDHTFDGKWSPPRPASDGASPSNISMSSDNENDQETEASQKGYLKTGSTDCLPKSIRCMEAAMASNALAIQLQKEGIVPMLFDIYNRKPAQTEIISLSHPHSLHHSIIAALRTMASHDVTFVVPRLAEVLREKLLITRMETLDFRGPIVNSEPLVCAKCADDLLLTEYLLGLAAGISRNSAQMIIHFNAGVEGKPNSSLLALMGEVERSVARQVTLSQDWQMVNSATEAVARGKEIGAQASAVLKHVFPDTEHVAQQASTVLDVLGQTPAATATPQEETPPAPQPAATSPLDLLHEEPEPEKPKEPEKSKQAHLYQVFTQVLGTLRVLYCQIAKHVHTSNNMRRRVIDPSPTLVLACAHVAMNLRDALRYINSMWPGLIEGFPETATTASDRYPISSKGIGAPFKAVSYLTFMASGMSAVLFDPRRRTCHSLVLNYFVACGGLDIVLNSAQSILRMLECFGPKAELGKVAGLSEEEKVEQVKTFLLRGVIHNCMQGFLHLLDLLVDAQLICNSPSAATLLLTPVPGCFTKSAFQTPQAFCAHIQDKVMKALGPVWQHSTKINTVPEFARKILSILTKTTNGPGRASPVFEAPSRPREEVDPAIVQQIVDMGFSARHAQEALRQVSYGVEHHSVEMAIEWVVAHPETELPPDDSAAVVMQSKADNPPEGFFLRGIPPLQSPSKPEQSTSDEASSSTATQAVPTNKQLVEASLQMLQNSDLVFEVGDLVAVLAQKDDGAHKAEIVKIITQGLLEAGHRVIDQQNPPTKEEEMKMKHIAHLLCVLSAANVSGYAYGRPVRLSRETYESGAAGIAINFLRMWVVRNESGDQTATIPPWMDPLLVMLDCLASVQHKQPPAAASRPSHQEAPADGAENFLNRLVFPFPGNRRLNRLDFDEMREAANNPMGLPQPEAADSSAPRAADTAGPSSSAAPKPDEKAERSASPDKDKAAEDKKNAVASLQDSIQSYYKVGGLLSEQEQQGALDVCVKLLSHTVAQPPQKQMTEASLNAAADSCRAVLQLMARLTKSFPLAQQALNAKIPSLLFALPPHCLRAEQAAHICAIFRRLIEDPATLQTAMEAEIASTLVNRAPFRGGGEEGYPMQLSQFLQMMEVVIGRDPRVFFQALLATCRVKTVGGRPYVGLKPKEAREQTGNDGDWGDLPANDSAEQTAKQTPQVKKAGEGKTPRARDELKNPSAKSSSKSLRKAVHPNLVEVVDVLVDKVMQFSMASLPKETSEKDKEKSNLEESRQAQEAGPSSSSPPLQPEAAEEAGQAAAAASAAGGAAPTAPGDPSQDAAKAPKILDERGHQLLVQFLCMKILAELTLKFTPTVALLLRRDSEFGAKTPFGKTPKKEIKQTGILIRHILAQHIASGQPHSWHLNELARNSAGLMLAIVIRSYEGRKRVIQSISESLAMSSKTEHQIGDSKSTSNSERVQALAELVFAITSINPKSISERSSATMPQPFVDTMRCLGKSGVREALLAHLRSLDFSETKPGSPDMVTLITRLLRPLEVLTRPQLQAAMKGELKEQTTAPEGSDKNVDTPTAREEATQAARRPPQGNDLEARPSLSESAAGPDAMALAAHVMAQGRPREDSGRGTLFEAIRGMDPYEVDQMMQDMEGMIGSAEEDDDMDEDEMDDEDDPPEDPEGDEEDDEDDDDEDDDDDDDMSDDYPESVPSFGDADQFQDDHQPGRVMVEMEMVVPEGAEDEEDEDEDDDQEDVFFEGDGYDPEMLERELDALSQEMLPPPAFVFGRAGAQAPQQHFLEPLPEAQHFNDNRQIVEDATDAELQRAAEDVAEMYGEEDEEEEDDEDGEDQMDEEEDDGEDGEYDDDAHNPDILHADNENFDMDMDLDLHYAPPGDPLGGRTLVWPEAFLSRGGQEMIEHMMSALGLSAAGRPADPRRRTGFGVMDRGASLWRHALLQRPVRDAAGVPMAVRRRLPVDSLASLEEQVRNLTRQLNLTNLHAQDLRQQIHMASLHDPRELRHVRRIAPRDGPGGHTIAAHASAGGATRGGPGARPRGILTECIELLTRVNSLRTNPDAWSDNGLPVNYNSVMRQGILTGTLERQIAEVLSEPEPQRAPEAPPANTAPADPGQVSNDPTANEPKPDESTAQDALADAPPPVVPPTEDASMGPASSDVSMRSNSEPATSSQPPGVSLGAQAPTPPSTAAPEAPTAAGPPAAEAQAATISPRDAEMGESGQQHPPAASPSPIDSSFLEALPTELRGEAEAAQQETRTTPVADTAPSAAADPPSEEIQPAAEPTSQANADLDADLPPIEPVDPAFLDALPAYMAQEVQEQQRRDIRNREQLIAARRVQREEAAVRAGVQGNPSASEIAELAAVIADFSQADREEFLLTTDQSTLMQLGMAEEAQEVRRRRDASFRQQYQAQVDRMAHMVGGREAGLGGAMPGIMGRRNPITRPSSAFPQASQFDKTALEHSAPPVTQEDIAKLITILCQFPSLSGAHHHHNPQTALMRMLSNLVVYRKSRRSLLQMLVLFMTAEARHSTLLESIKLPEGKDRPDTRIVANALNTLAKENVTAAQELAYLNIPWPAPKPTVEDTKGKGSASTQRLEPGIHILLKILGSDQIKGNSQIVSSVLNLLESVLEGVNTTKAAAISRPGKRSRPGDLEILTEDAEVPPQPSEAGPSAQATPRGADAPAGSSGGASGVENDAELEAQAVKQIPHAYLQNLVDLLGLRNISEAAAKHVAVLCSALAEKDPSLCAPLIKAMRSRLDSSGIEAKEELGKLAKRAPDFDLHTLVAQSGSAVLHILNAIERLRHHTQAELAWEREETMKSQYLKLQSLWDVLSSVMSAIEEKRKGVAPLPSDPDSVVLPPEADQVLPLVEAFFTMCEARAATAPRPEASLLRASSAELSKSGLASSSSAGLSPALSKELPPEQREALDAHLPLIRFAELQKSLLNGYIKQKPSLLEGSFAPLVKQPRLIDFDAKKHFFKSAMTAHKERGVPGVRLNVRRDHLFEDTFRQMNVKTPAEFKGELRVHFAGEEGADMGGLRREWYQIIAREIFNANWGIFIAVPEGSSTFQPNPNSVVQNDRGTNHLDYFRFVGRVIGKALYDNQTIDAYFTRSLYKHMLSQPLTYEDLEAVDPEYFNSLGWILKNDIEDLMIDETFTAEVDYFGRKEVVELKPGGKDIKLTEANKKEFVDLKAQQSMTTAIGDQLKAFLGGFWDIIPKDIVKIFNDKELELLISGLPEIDVEDMKANTEFGGFKTRAPIMRWFWDVVRELDSQDRALLVQFITGTSKVPLEGFKALMGSSGPQKMAIVKSHGSTNHLPLAHTCFNQLDLPEYESKEQLRDRLLVAIRHGYEGFGFQ